MGDLAAILSSAVILFGVVAVRDFLGGLFSFFIAIVIISFIISIISSIIQAVKESAPKDTRTPEEKARDKAEKKAKERAEMIDELKVFAVFLIGAGIIAVVYIILKNALDLP